MRVLTEEQITQRMANEADARKPFEQSREYPHVLGFSVFEGVWKNRLYLVRAPLITLTLDGRLSPLFYVDLAGATIEEARVKVNRTFTLYWTDPSKPHTGTDENCVISLDGMG